VEEVFPLEVFLL